MKLNLYDETLKRIAAIEDRFVSCFWSEGYNTLESFVVELQDTEEYRKKMRPGCFVGRSDRNTVMVITTVEIKNGRISASGFPAARLLKDVSVVNRPYNHVSVAYSIYEGYITSASQNPILTMNKPTEKEEEVQWKSDMTNVSLLELAETACQTGDLGFRVVKDGQMLYIQTYYPEDTGKLVYSEQYGNLAVNSIVMSSEAYKNYAIVVGYGMTAEVDETNGEMRRDLVIDGSSVQWNEGESDSDYLGKLADLGTDTLLKHRKTWECAFTPLSDDFGKKFDLGDILTVLLPDMGMTLKARVSRFTQKEQNNQTKTTIEVGQITIKKG